MSGVAATTIYDVVTRYRIEDQATTPARRVRTEMDRTAVATRSTVANFAMLSRYVGPMLSMATAIGVTRRVVSGLNEETNRTIQLASQFNLAFKFDADPARQFAASMRESQKLVGEIISDAARLPGESKDFFGILALISGAGFRAGAGAQGVRRMTANLAMAAPFAGQNPEDAGRQAFRMLSGQTSIGDNPLFATLTASGLLPSAAKFNAQPLARRFEMLDAALKKLVDNPFFRELVTNTPDTQWSTLKDLLFGPRGIGGQLMSGPYSDIVSGLRTLNEGLSTNVPGIVAGIQNLFGLLGGVPTAAHSGMNAPIFSNEGQLGLRSSLLARSALRDLIGAKEYGYLPTADRDQITSLLSVYYRNSLHDPGGPYSEQSIAQALSGVRAQIGGREISGSDEPLARGITIPKLMEMISGSMQAARGLRAPVGELRNEEAPSVTNTFHVRIDLKTDDSPEAIALSFEKAMDRMSWAPKRARRGIAATTSPSTVSP